MNTLTSFDRTKFTGLYNVRNAILDYCDSHEQAQQIIGRIFRMCNDVERDNPDIRVVTEFELRHICMEDETDCIDVHLMRCRDGESMSVLRLYQRNGQLTPMTETEEIESEAIPVSMHGRKIKNISAPRMRTMLNNSKVMFCEEVLALASSVIDAFAHTATEETTVFHLEIHKRCVTLHAHIEGLQALHLSLPLSWFAKKKDRPTVTIPMGTVTASSTLQ